MSIKNLALLLSCSIIIVLVGVQDPSHDLYSDDLKLAQEALAVIVAKTKTRCINEDLFLDTTLTEDDVRRINLLLTDLKLTDSQRYIQLRQVLAFRQENHFKALHKKGSPEYVQRRYVLNSCMANVASTAKSGLISVLGCFVAHMAQQYNDAKSLVGFGGIGTVAGGFALHYANNVRKDLLTWWRGDVTENIRQARVLATIFDVIDANYSPIKITTPEDISARRRLACSPSRRPSARAITG